MNPVSHVMTTSHLTKIQPIFDNGICYHITVPERVAELTTLVNKYARPFDPSLPEAGTAYLRLNTTTKKSPNSESWQMGGGALVVNSIDDQIESAKAAILSANPEHEIADTLVTAWILNEWDRFSVVFELYVTLKAKTL